MNLQEAAWQHRAPDADGDCSAPLMPWKDYQHANTLGPARNSSKRAPLSISDRLALFLLAAAILMVLICF